MIDSMPPRVLAVGVGIAAAGIVEIPWTTVELVHCAIWPFVGVPVFDTFPPPDGVAQVSVPSVLIFCTNCPPDEQSLESTPPSVLALGVGRLVMSNFT
jgi:hypothetical protein